jgi:hypothetical protein
MTEHSSATWGSKAGQKEGDDLTGVMTLERRERGGAVTPGAEPLGGQRIPVTGRERGGTVDHIKHEALRGQVPEGVTGPAKQKIVRGWATWAPYAAFAKPGGTPVERLRRRCPRSIGRFRGASLSRSGALSEGFLRVSPKLELQTHVYPQITAQKRDSWPTTKRFPVKNGYR